MWDSLSKIIIHIIDKVSFTRMFFFIFIFSLVWFFIPYEKLTNFLAPRELPVGLYWGILFMVSAGIFLLGKKLFSDIHKQFKQWRAFHHWKKIYATLSEEELNIIKMLISQDHAPLELNNKQAFNLVSKGIIQVKFFHPMFNSYLLTPSFRRFILAKYQKEIIK
ncbi:hypothetical protein [Gallibacterium anatis]|uniref:hypothetical protein n=1 Tax=Gallibacterium anatis TaxID=750 RepID=UPI000BA02A03|nr:hypothetical protein [Gallibacterium anatis]WAX71588.1 hypothetical protein CF557_00615 [Gallibacterium anatis]